jgi:hypothetical protein
LNDETLKLPIAPFKSMKEALRYSVSLVGRLASRCQGLADMKIYRHLVSQYADVLSENSWNDDILIEQAREQLEKEKYLAGIRDQDLKLQLETQA